MIDIKQAIYLAVLVICLTSSWYFTREHYLKKIDEFQLGMAEAVQNELLGREEKRQKAEVQHETDQHTIDNLHNQLGRLQVNGICRSTVQQGKDSDGATGVLSSRVDEEFARFQSRVSEIIQRCDQLNIDAIKLNN